MTKEIEDESSYESAVVNNEFANLNPSESIMSSWRSIPDESIACSPYPDISHNTSETSSYYYQR